MHLLWSITIAHLCGLVPAVSEAVARRHPRRLTTAVTPAARALRQLRRPTVACVMISPQCGSEVSLRAVRVSPHGAWRWCASPRLTRWKPRSSHGARMMPKAMPIRPAKTANPTGLTGLGAALTVVGSPEDSELAGAGVGVTSAATSMAAAGLCNSAAWHLLHLLR